VLQYGVIKDVWKETIKSIKRFFLKITKSCTEKSFGTLLTGTAVSQIMAFIASPLLARLYTPANFSIFAIFSSLVGIAIIVAPFKFDQVISLPESTSTARIAVLFALIMTAVTTLLAVAAAIWLPFQRISHLTDIKQFVVLAPFIFAFTGIGQVVQGWMLRSSQYVELATLRVRQVGTGLLATIAAGIFSWGAWGLLFGQIIQISSGLLRPFSSLVRSRSFDAGLEPLSKRLRLTWKQYGHLAAFNTGAGLFNALASAAPPTILLVTYGPAVAGSFAFAQRIISVPMSLVGSAASQSFMGEGARILRTGEGDLSALFQDVTRRLSWVALGISLIGIMCPMMFPLIFGSNWALAGSFALMLAGSAALQVVVSPVSVSAMLVEHRWGQMVLDAIRLVVVVSALIVPKIWNWDANIAVGLYAAAMAAVYLISFFWYRQLIRTMSMGSKLDKNAMA
jgi:O-antigen/teichoic acid export membrane protein